jgi:hypothetical protein
MKRVASILGLQPLALILAGTLVFSWLGTGASMLASKMGSQLGSGAQSVVQAALYTESYMSGDWLNVFAPNTNSNPASQFQNFSFQNFSYQKLAGLYQQYHVPGDPVQVECVGFVEMTFGLVNIHLPVSEQYADQYWQGFAGQQGWQEIPNGTAPPLPGDIIIWQGGLFGHIAVVVAVNPPVGGQNGSVVIAQANAPGNFTTPDARAPGFPAGLELYAMPLSSSNFVTTWDGYKVLGWVRDLAAQSTLLAAQSNGGYAVTGSPTITPAHIDSILAANGSPAQGSGLALYSLGVQSGIDPIYALAFFQHESSFGKSGIANANLSLGNIRCTSGYVCMSGFRAYPNWEAGYADWYQLIKQEYVARGLVTVDQIIPVYAPSSDNNNVAGYITAVEQAVNQWRSGTFV